MTLARCFTTLSLNFSYVNSNGTNFTLTLFQTVNEIAPTKPLAKFMEHEKHPRNVNSFVFDGDGIDIIVTNKSRQSQRLIPDCSLVGLGVGGVETENRINDGLWAQHPGQWP